MSRTIDTEDIARRARRMSVPELHGAAKDACYAAVAAEELERHGNRVDKDGGYYRDEAGIYRTEIRRRASS